MALHPADPNEEAQVVFPGWYSKRVLAVWESLSVQTRMLLLSHRTLKPDDWQETGVLWPRRIVDALRQRNVTLAQDELRKHLAKTFQSVVESSTEDKTEAADSA